MLPIVTKSSVEPKELLEIEYLEKKIQMAENREKREKELHDALMTAIKVKNIISNTFLFLHLGKCRAVEQLTFKLKVSGLRYLTTNMELPINFLTINKGLHLLFA